MPVLDFDTINEYHQVGSWTKEMVWNAVKWKKLTEEEYEMITGDKYPLECPKGNN